MRRQSVLKIFLLTLFVGYFCAANLFSHIHVLVNGQKITHSHPYKAGHTHNTCDYQLIQDLTHFSFLYDAVEISVQTVEIQLPKKEFYYRKDYICQIIQDCSGRDPPSFI